jgi:hypothetical protein
MPNNDSPHFVTRYKNAGLFPHVDNGDGSISTHRMAAEIDEDGRAYAFPTIAQTDEGELIEFKDPFDALEYNKSKNNVIEFDSIEEANEYAKGGYKKDSYFDPDKQKRQAKAIRGY